jgi:L-threonylcarbamoyladenylate synthase
MSRFFDCSLPLERASGLEAATDAVRRGGLVVLPTDTVYGVGADAFLPRAVSALLAAKKRGREMPVPVLVGSWRTLDGLAASLPHQARALVEAFWPGGLTLVVTQAPSLAWDLGETGGTVAVRMPLHPVALELLQATGPLAVSSANLSGGPSPATAREAQEQLGWSVDVYLESGSTGEPTASTIVDVTTPTPRLLRAGTVTLDDLREVVPETRGLEEQ